MIETPSAGRANIFKNGDTIEVQMPARKNLVKTIFLIVWLAGFMVAGVYMIKRFDDSETPLPHEFRYFFVGGLAFGVLSVIPGILWSVAGQEMIKVENGVMEIGKQIFSLGTSKKYNLQEVRHFSINATPDNHFWTGNQRNLLGQKSGVLTFDYGLKTLKFAAEIDEAEGRLLIEMFKTNPNFNEANFG